MVLSPRHVPVITLITFNLAANLSEIVAVNRVVIVYKTDFFV